MTAIRPTAKTLATVAERDEGRCGYCGDEVYGERGEDWSLQHRRRAGMGGDRRPETHAPGNLILLCGSGTTRCHGHVESYRDDAMKTGHAVSANKTPTLQPIDHAVHGRVLLDDEGGWTACE